MELVDRSIEGDVRASLTRADGLTVVHGLGGMGASTIVARALGETAFVRWDLGGPGLAKLPRRAQAEAARGPRVLWLDQAHAPIAPAALTSLRARWPGPIVIAGRLPTGRADERCFPVPPLERERVRALLEAELGRLGSQESEEAYASLVDAIDGWPLAIAETATRVRAVGPQVVLATGIVSPGGPTSPCREVVADAWDALGRAARDLLATLSFARTPLPIGAVCPSPRTEAALADLVRRGLVRRVGDRVIVPRSIATRVPALVDAASATRAGRTYGELVLRLGEDARDRSRRDPVGTSAELAALRGDLLALSCDEVPRTAVRAALALEPLLTGLLLRGEVLAMFERARRAALQLDEGTRAKVALALARTLITRAEHESAERILQHPADFAESAYARSYRAIYLGHIALWRNELTVAKTWLAQVDETVAPEVEEDTLVQRLHLSLRENDPVETARLVRIAMAIAEGRPSPRLGALAQYFLAEARLLEGNAREAVRLFEGARFAIHVCGDHVGALFLSVRLVEALRAAGDDVRADHEAQSTHASATRGGELAFELVVLGAADGERVPWERVAELAWRVQIPLLRAQAERWMAARPPRPPGPRLLLEGATKTATLGGRRLSFATRPTLWRALLALANAHDEPAALAGEALFAAAWPGERAEAISRKKRVQTAIWSLRKLLLGEHLETSARGYFLARDLRVERLGD